VVLTADRTLMADYPTLLDGMMATVQTSVVPDALLRRCLSPPMPQANGRAARAPLGVRRLEAALRAGGAGQAGRPGEQAGGLSDREVAVVTPEGLDAAVGPATRVVGISSGDPLGKGMTNTTMVAVSGGQLYTAKWYAALCRRVRRLRERAPQMRVIAGGPGAWQLANDPAATEALGIDHVFVGYVEAEAPRLFARLLAGEAVGPVVRAGRGTLADIPAIEAATSMGVVEVSRGCGRGCGFCTIAAEPMVHLPIDRIVADVETNVRGGVRAVSLVSEDLFRYGSPDVGVDAEALLAMLSAVQAVPGVRMIQVDHVNISSVMQLSDEDLRRVRGALRVGPGHNKLWVNLGVESAAGELLVANGLVGKVHPFDPADWADLCERAVCRLVEAGFVPMASLILGLPGETDEHVRRSLEWVRRIEHLPGVAFPVFYAPIAPGERPFGIDDMTESHWRLFRACYAMNFRWIPRMFWDNSSAAGAPLWRRLFIQLAGRGQKAQWQMKFRRIGKGR